MILETLLPTIVGGIIKHFTENKEIIQVAQENAVLITAGSGLVLGNLADIFIRRVPTKKRRSIVLYLADILIICEKLIDGLKWFSGKLRSFLEWYDGRVEKIIPNRSRND
jgi:hypothetical protein